MNPMLPDTSSPLLSLVALRRWWQRALGMLMVVVLSLTLSACDSFQKPPRAVVLQALSLQIQLTQTAIAQSLDLEPIGSPDVSRVRIKQRQALNLGDQKGLRLTGRFDWQLPGDQVSVDSPFELFLEEGELGQSWRLAQPIGSADGVAQDWTTYPLAIDVS